MVLDYDTARHRPLPSDALKSCQDLMTHPYLFPYFPYFRRHFPARWRFQPSRISVLTLGSRKE